MHDRWFNHLIQASLFEASESELDERVTTTKKHNTVLLSPSIVTSFILPIPRRKLPLKHYLRCGHHKLVLNLNAILRDQEDSVRPVGSGCLETCSWD